ncbi:hypothetical protein EYF80_056997 [Liparis tanakae]|uniref:Uncharacterized protein n=1 Tax=Liparis tanakae TaxID=230148 RepID=A0A4Z2EW95_9TELE|nr:hypothetical protein EYF80_056997 [Liparis tanakae]
MTNEHGPVPVPVQYQYQYQYQYLPTAGYGEVSSYMRICVMCCSPNAFLSPSQRLSFTLLLVNSKVNWVSDKRKI